MAMRHIADDIVRRLKAEGITVQRYDAMTSKSVYLKLDYGVLKTVRISDHKSKKHLLYRYNLGDDVRTRRYDRATQRFFYPIHDVDGMVRQILRDRDDKRRRYGNDYDAFMQDNIRTNQHRKGFWSDARIV